MAQTTTGKTNMTTTSQTTTGKTNMTTTSQTTTEKINMTTTSQTTTGKTNMPTTSQTTTGKTNIASSQTAAGKTNIPTTSQTNIPTTSQTTTGKTNMPTISQTTTGKTNMPTTSQTTTGKTNIATTSQTTTDKTNIATTSQTTAGTTNIPTTSQTTTGKTNIPTTSQTTTGMTNMPTISQTTTGKTNMPNTSQTTTGKTNIATTSRTTAGTTNIPNISQTNIPTTSQTTTGKTNIATTFQTTTGKTNMPTISQTNIPTTSQTTTGKTNIATTSQTTAGTTNIPTTSQTTTGKTNIATTFQTTTGLTNMPTISQTTTGETSIPTTSHTTTGKTNIATTFPTPTGKTNIATTSQTNTEKPDIATTSAALPPTGRVLKPEKTIILDKYELGKLVGRGAFAKVYQARHIKTGQIVAVKAVNKRRLVQGNLAAHVKREIAIMRRLRHPHTVRLYEVLATKTKIFFVMEFAVGGELFSKIAKGRFTENLSRHYFQQLISAVRYCHSRGVFHRDLKPENLLLDEKLNLKVSDFGLSAVKDQIRPDGRLHTLCGTPAYVSPEMLANKGYEGAKADVWSCGVVLFVLNAGYLPFKDSSVIRMYRKIYRGEFRLPKWTSPDLRHLLNRLLDTNPESRITVDQILDDPWFKPGYKEIPHLSDDFVPGETSVSDVNAFDIISRGPAFNLSGLFSDLYTPERSEQFVSAEKPSKIMKKVEEIADGENLAVTERKEWGLKLEGYNGTLVMIIEIRRLTDDLVVVELKKKDRTAAIEREIWRDIFRPQLYGLIYRPDGPAMSF